LITPVTDNGASNPLTYHSGPPQPCGNKHSKGYFQNLNDLACSGTIQGQQTAPTIVAVSPN
jgi:hypothetical protein